MTNFQAIVMGIIQGVGEFLPISSSGHLVLVPWFLGWEVPGITFDVALHMGTLLAVVIYFWRDWMRLLKAAAKKEPSSDKRLFWYLVVATIPAVIFGLALEDAAAEVFRSELLIGIMMILMGALLYWADLRPQTRRLESMRLKDAVLIGMIQALALIPGVSRSGSTMTMARLLNITREDAARFSFLLSTPIILGAGIFSLRHMTWADVNGTFIIGVVTSFIVGMLSISFLLRYLKTSNFKVFVIYRFIIGFLAIAVYFIRG